MRTLIRMTALVGGLVCLQACDGRWVEYTTNVTVGKDYQIRQTGPFEEAGAFTLDDLSDLSNEIPDGAEILEATITFLDVEYNVLESTNATSLNVYIVLYDLAASTVILTNEKSVGNWVVGPRATLNVIPASTRLAEMTKIRNQVNAFIKNNEQVSLGLGVGGEAVGGAFNADMTARMHLFVRYRVCEEISTGLVASDLGECSTVF